MRKKTFLIFILPCILCLFSGCENIKDTEGAATEIQEELPEEKEVRAAVIEDTESADASGKEASGRTFRYVALGNSVTYSEPDGQIWWGDWGMAATSAKKDYVNLIAKWLKEQDGLSVSTMVVDLKNWEISKNRGKALKKYGKYFDSDTDLVTIQTGENITDFKETLDEDYSKLVQRITELAPDAQIIMIGELLWPSEDIERAKRAACEEYGVQFLEMTEFLEDYDDVYRSAMGKKVSGSDGKMHKINDEAVAAHPNDKGMAHIAEQIIEQIQIQE